MTAGRAGPGRRRLGSALLVVAAALALLVAGTRLAGAVDDDAITATATDRSVALRAERDLSSPIEADPVGFGGPTIPADGPAPATGERRTWFAEGRWWAVLPDASGASTIWGLTGRDGPWQDTGVLVDDRPFARPRVAWTGSELVVAATGSRPYRAHGLRTTRFTWSSADDRWQQRTDFPVAVTDEGSTGTVLAATTDGRAWLVRERDHRLEVASTGPTGLDPSGFGPLPDGIAGTDVAGFAVAADGADLHVVWRSTTTDEVRWATFRAGRWSAHATTVYGAGGVGTIDAAVARGRLLVAVQTTLAARGTNDRDPAILLVALDGTGARTSVVSRNRDGLHEPTLVVDASTGDVHVLAVVDPDPGGSGEIVDKVARPPDLAFGVGRGTTLLRTRPGTRLAGPVVAAGSVDEASGLLVVATGRHGTTWRTVLRGGAPGATDVDVTTADRQGVVLHDTFDGLTTSDAPRSWRAADGGPASAAVTDDPAGYGRALHLTGSAASGAGTTCRPIPAGSGRTTVRADVTIEGRGRRDAVLLALGGPDGTLVSARLTRRDAVGWLVPQGRQTVATVDPSLPLRTTISVDPTSRTADVRIASGGAVVAEGDDLPLLVDGPVVVEEVCLGPPAGRDGTSLWATEVLARR